MYIYMNVDKMLIIKMFYEFVHTTVTIQSFQLILSPMFLLDSASDALQTSEIIKIKFSKRF